MAVVVLLRGVNVGGHRTFRPSELAKRLQHLDAVNIGAAGTLVIRKNVTRTQLRAELTRAIPLAARSAPSTPLSLPPNGEWLVRILARENQFVFGVYRRHMKVIGYLGALDKLFGVPATTRSWSTITAIAKVLGHDMS